MQKQIWKAHNGSIGPRRMDGETRTQNARRAVLARLYRRQQRRFVGKRFQNIIVLKRLKSRSSLGRTMWLVRCICKTEFAVPSYTLSRPRNEKRVRCPQCGVKDNRTINSYRAMLRRGKLKGIPVCKRWRKSFDNFLT